RRRLQCRERSHRLKFRWVGLVHHCGHGPWICDMHFELTSEQKLIQDSTHRMSEREIVPILKSNHPMKPLPKGATGQILKACASQGLTASRIPEADGGAGLSGSCTNNCRRRSPLDVLAHEVTVARIHFDSTAEQKARFLPDLIAADRIACHGNDRAGWRFRHADHCYAGNARR